MFKRMPIRFIYVLGMGVLLGLVIGFKSLIPYLYFGDIKEYEWGRSALPHIINYLFWPFLVPIIYWTFERYEIGKMGAVSDKLKTFGMSLLLPFIHELSTTILYFFLLTRFEMYDFTEESYRYIKAAFPSVYIGRVVEFWIIYGLFAAFDFYKKYKDKQAELGRIEAQLNRTKLAVLKMQLQPHFLFNALNSISSLMDLDVKKAQMVTAKLGDLLRGILEQDQRVFISLQEELEYVRTYLDIEKIRFEDRLDVKYEIQDEALDIPIPILLIQPLVENAIKHGIAPISRPGFIKTKAFVQDEYLIIIIEDNGRGQNASTNEIYRKGIGLKNVQERLQQLYPNQHKLNISTGSKTGFKIEIQIPTKLKRNEND